MSPERDFEGQNSLGRAGTRSLEEQNSLGSRCQGFRGAEFPSRKASRYQEFRGTEFPQERASIPRSGRMSLCPEGQQLCEGEVLIPR